MDDPLPLAACVECFFTVLLHVSERRGESGGADAGTA
jgi:hypothetical protein